MIYVLQGDGQMCNRIVYFVNALAVAIEFRQNITHLFADEICKFTDGVPGALPECCVTLRDHKGSKLINYIYGKLWRFDCVTRRYYDGNARRIASFRRRSWRIPLVLWNWCFRYDEGIVKHRAKICAYLRAKSEFETRPREVLENVRAGFGGIVVGVHVRRGDYKEFKGGSLYYDDAQYLKWMREFSASVDAAVRFVIVSNETVDPSFFTDRGCDVVVSSGLAQEDVITLSICDYIMGPVSTFSWWAAYYGDKPRLAFEHVDDSAAVQNFHKITALITRFPRRDDN